MVLFRRSKNIEQSQTMFNTGQSPRCVLCVALAESIFTINIRCFVCSSLAARPASFIVSTPHGLHSHQSSIWSANFTGGVPSLMFRLLGGAL